jgi:hypothetical protein
MKVELWKNDLMVLPETHFEHEFLNSMETDKVFVKRGLSLTDVIGLKIECLQLADAVDNQHECWYCHAKYGKGIPCLTCGRKGR